MKFTDTTIAQNYSQAFWNRESRWDVGPTYVPTMYKILMTSIADFLKIIMEKDKGLKKAAVVIETISGQFLMAGIVESHEGVVDEDMPGNYSYVLSFDESDIADAATFKSSDNSFCNVASNVAHGQFGLKMKDTNFITDLFSVAISSLTEWLDVNAKPGEQVDVELDGYFVAKVAIEDGEKVMAIEPDGAMKRLIKNDKVKEK